MQSAIYQNNRYFVAVSFLELARRLKSVRVPLSALKSPNPPEYFVRRSILLTIVLVAIFSVSAFAQVVTREIQASGTGVVLVQFYTGGLADKLGKNIAVIDSAGKAVPYRLMSHDPDGTTLIAVDFKDQSVPLSVQYSSKPLTVAKPGAEITPSLLMQTYPFTRRAFRNAGDLAESLGASKSMGAALIEEINFAHNPFGPSVNFATIFTGVLHLDETKTLRLIAANDDAAFVEIDGKTVIANTGPQLESDALRLARMAKEVTLEAGDHPIRYIHIQTDGRTLAVLGYVTSGGAFNVPAGMFKHSDWATLGSATVTTSPGQKAPAVFDAQQREQMAFADWTFTRFTFTAAMPVQVGQRWRWTFGDGTVWETKPASASNEASNESVMTYDSQETDPNVIEHVYVAPAAAFPTWKVTLDLLDSKGLVVSTATSVVRPTVLKDLISTGNSEILAAYAKAIAQADYTKADPAEMTAYFDLMAVTERPALMAPIAEPFVKRFGERGGPKIWEMKHALAVNVARDDPARAAKLFGELSKTAKDSWAATCAAAEQADLMIFRLGKTQKDELNAILIPMYRDRPPRERALLRARLGDAYRITGKPDLAAEAYREAQQDTIKQMDPKKAAVLERAYRETAMAYLQQKRYPALRDQLFQWEADFPLANLGGELPLLRGRYFQEIGDDPRAAKEFASLLDLNPLHPARPEITFRLAQSLKRMGKKDEARKQFDIVIKEYPNSPFADEAKHETAYEFGED